MAKRPRQELIIEALRVSGGVVSVAASKLTVSRQTLHDWIKNDSELKSACNQVREETLDLAEGKLLELVTKGDREAVKFYLRCQGKSRGWHDRVEMTGTVNTNVVADAAVLDLLKLSPKELQTLETLANKAANASDPGPEAH